jgi:GTP-binding protein Era
MDNHNTNDTQFRAGYIAVMGRPNVGKSTLVNALLGQKVAAVSPRPQTTRRRQLGILTTSQAQIIFVDTPGVHLPRHKLGENMNLEARSALEHCDGALFIVDASEPPTDEDRRLAALLTGLPQMPHVWMVLNKVDRVSPENRAHLEQAYVELLPAAPVLWVSALRGDSLGELLQVLLSHLPLGEPFFPAEQVTDLYEREIAADLIREACLNILREEIPHGIAVRVDDYQERGETGAYIVATVFVEKESHKPIVIGEKGVMLKRIGSAARQEIEAMSGRKVYLELRIKLRKNWRDDEKVLRQMYQ